MVLSWCFCKANTGHAILQAGVGLDYPVALFQLKQSTMMMIIITKVDILNPSQHYAGS